MKGAPRIPLLDTDDARARGAALGLSEQLATLNVFRTMLHQEPVAKAVAGTLTTLLFTGNRLDVRLRELVIMRIGWQTGSCYEWTQHWRVARGLNIPERDLLAVRDWRAARCFAALERAALAATDETLQDGHISNRTWPKLGKQLPADQLVELVIAIGNWNMFSQLLQSLAVPLEDGIEPWPPDGRAPKR
jgi:alkylhydroperoxidase family enzyme